MTSERAEPRAMDRKRPACNRDYSRLISDLSGAWAMRTNVNSDTGSNLSGSIVTSGPGVHHRPPTPLDPEKQANSPAGSSGFSPLVRVAAESVRPTPRLGSSGEPVATPGERR